ncbi:hypothetical protein M5K25_015742 [Dendrobium thyrsiflorum]|uniref:Uncharacterized protein n=1 Tax=Dendrobium thyrsiflorum TaxID=117978 RepID=A0ABD0URV0_DENTH
MGCFVQGNLEDLGWGRQRVGAWQEDACRILSVEEEKRCKLQLASFYRKREQRSKQAFARGRSDISAPSQRNDYRRCCGHDVSRDSGFRYGLWQSS